MLFKFMAAGDGSRTAAKWRADFEPFLLSFPIQELAGSPTATEGMLDAKADRNECSLEFLA